MLRWQKPVAAQARREVGAVMIEFALVALLFLWLVLALLELGVLAWAHLSMQHAVREAARVALTMQPGPDMPRHRYIFERLQAASFGVYQRLDEPCIATAIDGTDFSPCYEQNVSRAGMFGKQNQRVHLLVDGCWRLLTPLTAFFFPLRDKYCFQAETVYRNEP